MGCGRVCSTSLPLADALRLLCWSYDVPSACCVGRCRPRSHAARHKAPGAAARSRESPLRTSGCERGRHHRLGVAGCTYRGAGASVSRGALFGALHLLCVPHSLLQVARVASPSLPPLLRTAYDAAALLLFQGVVAPAACSGAYAFASEVRASWEGRGLRGVSHVAVLADRSDSLEPRSLRGHCCSPLCSARGSMQTR